MPGWFQKLDNFPDTDWSYDPTAANAVTGYADASLMGYESVCAGETTQQDTSITLNVPMVMHNRQWSPRSDYIHDKALPFHWLSGPKWTIPDDPERPTLSEAP